MARAAVAVLSCKNVCFAVDPAPGTSPDVSFLARGERMLDCLSFRVLFFLFVVGNFYPGKKVCKTNMPDRNFGSPYSTTLLKEPCGPNYTLLDLKF